jgi:ribonuclease HI
MLMINTFQKWIPGWKARGWKKADGGEIKNLDLVKEIDELLSLNKRKLLFSYVKAHTGKQDWISIHNDMADKMAKEACLFKF